jgi:hypothetical protein
MKQIKKKKKLKIFSELRQSLQDAMRYERGDERGCG